LPLDQFATDGVHSDTTSLLVEPRQQSDDFILSALTENLQTPRTIFAAAPGKKNSPHRDPQCKRFVE
jgi:hypothetical protein